MNILFTDKTGTLTTGIFKVSNVRPACDANGEEVIGSEQLLGIAAEALVIFLRAGRGRGYVVFLVAEGLVEFVTCDQLPVQLRFQRLVIDVDPSVHVVCNVKALSQSRRKIAGNVGNNDKLFHGILREVKFVVVSAGKV